MSRRLIEFFQSDAGPLSMSRLLMLGTFIVASVIMVWLTSEGNMNEGYMAMYLSFGGGVYLGGKKMDSGQAAKT